MEEALHEQSFSTELEGPEAGGGRGQFGAGPTLLFTMPRFSTPVIVLCMSATVMSGAICMVAGVLFWATTGVEEIDSIIDPIAVGVARKRGWSWGKSLKTGAAQADAAANPLG